MRTEDVDLLRAFLEEHPELGERFDLEVPAVDLDGISRPIQSLRLQRHRLTLALVGGGHLTLTASEGRRAVRSRFWREFRELLRRELPRYRILHVLRGTDRIRHQSASVLRFWMGRGRERVAGLAVCPEDGTSSLNRLLSALLIWWNDLENSASPFGAFLFVPQSCGENFLARLAMLKIPITCWKYRLGEGHGAGSLWKIFPRQRDGAELGSPYVMFTLGGPVPGPLMDLSQEFQELDLSLRHGRWELSYLGFPLAWQEEGPDCCFGVSRREALTGNSRDSFLRHFGEVRALRCFPSRDPGHPFYTFKPERWLESLVVRNLQVVSRELQSVVYAQVPSFVQGERKVLDLVSVTRRNRLAVIELKPEKDLDLFFQAFDYWERVALHLKRGDFQRRGYFPGLDLENREPLLFLVSPLFEFHRIFSILRRYLRSRVRFQCVGINADWRSRLRLVRRFQV